MKLAERKPRRQSELRSDLGDCASSQAECLAGSLVHCKMGSKCPVYIRERRAAVTGGILKIKKKKKRNLSLALSVKCSEKSLLATLACSTWWNIYSSGSELCPSEM